MIWRSVALVALVALAGCDTMPTKAPEPVRVEVPVKVPCIDKEPVKPVYQFGVGEKPSGKDKAALLAADFEAAEKYGHDWEAAAAGCMKPSPLKPTQAQ